MKLFRPLLATLLLGACFLARPAAAQETPAAAPAAEEINLDFFYNNLQDKGDWLQTDEYGYVFRPKIGAEKADWRPYSDGYWAHTDEGWLWNSYEDFGWATYHYGRWTRLKDYGWVWVPGYEWAPAWVAWRGTSPDGGDTSDAPPPPDAKTSAQVNYIGWAPLPPEARFEETVGFTSAVDYQYGLTPEYYNFVPVQSFGNPYLAPLIIAPLAAYAFWGLTYGYTNYAYNNYGWGRGVYCGGPRYGYYNAYAARPINQYNIQRNFAYANGGVNNFRPGRPVNGVMPVFTPRVNAANAATFKPANVKAKVPPGQVQKSWVGNPEQVQQAKAVTQAQAAKAAPAHLPGPQARAITPAGAAVTGGALGAAAAGKNQLSPQNAARVQANQAAKGLPATVPAGAGAGAPNAEKLTKAQTRQAKQAEARAARTGNATGEAAQTQTGKAKKSANATATGQGGGHTKAHVNQGGGGKAKQGGGAQHAAKAPKAAAPKPQKAAPPAKKKPNQ